MLAGRFLVLPLILILLSSSVIPYSFASVESEAQEDILAGCRDEQTLVYRLTYGDYICLDPSTADRWVELGIAEIIQNATKGIDDQEIDDPNVVYYGAPPPPPIQNPATDNDSECRDGFTLVHRFSYDDLQCVDKSAAQLWKRLELVEIIENSDEYFSPQKDEPMISPENILEEQQKQFQSQAELISLPEYPNQPPIHPKLKATNDLWSPPKIHQVNDRIWVAVGYDAANSIMIEGDTGLIIVDTLSTYESAKIVMEEFRKLTNKPVKTIIYTHGHLDHVQGTKAFLEEGDGAVEIIAHDSLLDFYISENSMLGQIASIRSSFAAGSFLPDEGPDRNNLGVFPRMQPGTIAFVPPTHTFSSNFSLDISGVKMNLVHVGGESSDQLYAWLPEDDALLIGDNIYGIFPNIYSLRGTVYRDPMNYVNALDNVIPLEPEYLVPSHVKPVTGKDEIQDILISTRDATQYVYDQTIRGMNAGYSVDELTTLITLPEYAKDNPWITEARGQIPWHVKQIYYGNLGWFEGDPAFLLPVSENERSKKIVDGFGGVNKTILKIRTAIEHNEYNWAAELATLVLNVDPDNVEAKLLKAHALRVIGQRMLSSDGRHWALTSALELEGKIIIDQNKFSQTSPEQLAEIPVEKLLKLLSTRLNVDIVNGTNGALNIIYTDTGEKYSLLFRNNILIVNQGLNDDPWNTLSLDISTHKKIISNQLSMRDALNSGLIDFEGTLDDLEWYSDAFNHLS